MAGLVMACRRRTLLLLRRSTAAAPSAPLPLPASYGVPYPVLQRRVVAPAAPPISVLQRPFASSTLPPPASSASQHRLSAASPSAPLSASDAPAGDLERRADLVLVSYLKGLFKVKLLLGLLGLFGVSLMYSTYIAWNGDIPRNQGYLSHLLINRENEAKRLEELINNPGRFFIVVRGYPGCGKTSLVRDIARKRGSAVYIDAASVDTFVDLEKKVNANYQNLYQKLSHIIYNNQSSGLETFNLLSRVVEQLPGGQRLLVIVDHVHKLKPEDALRLVSWAKTSADDGSVIPVLIGSDMSKNLLYNSDRKSRGLQFEIDHPKPQHVREALQEYAKANPERSIDIEELLYLSGGFPSRLASLVGGNIPMPECPDMKYEELWYALLIAGPDGLDAMDVSAYGNDDIFHLDELVKINKRLYYKSGLDRDAAAQGLADRAKIMERPSSSARKLVNFEALGFATESTKRDRIKEVQQERMKEVQKVMMNRTYEAYRPSAWSVLPLPASSASQYWLSAAAAFSSAPPSTPPPSASDCPV